MATLPPRSTTATAPTAYRSVRTVLSLPVGAMPSGGSECRADVDRLERVDGREGAKAGIASRRVDGEIARRLALGAGHEPVVEPIVEVVHHESVRLAMSRIFVTSGPSLDRSLAVHGGAGAHRAPPGSPHEPLEARAVEADDRRDVTPVQPLDRRHHQRRALAEVERAQAGECGVIDAQLLEGGPSAVRSRHLRASPAGLADDPLPEPCRRPLRMAELRRTGGTGRQRIGGKTRRNRLVAERQEEGEAVEPGTMQLTEGGALQVGRHGGVAL